MDARELKSEFRAIVLRRKEKNCHEIPDLTSQTGKTSVCNICNKHLGDCHCDIYYNFTLKEIIATGIKVIANSKPIKKR